MSTTEYDIHDESIKSGCIQLKAHIYRHIYSEYFFESIDSMNKIIDYIVKLERENLGLKEYKKHQERANERRYRSGEESCIEVLLLKKINRLEKVEWLIWMGINLKRLI